MAAGVEAAGTPTAGVRAAAGVERLASGRTAAVAEGVGIGTGWTVAAGVGVGAGDGVWPDGGRLKSRTGGVMIAGGVLSCAATGAARSMIGISALVARREYAVTRGALA